MFKHTFFVIHLFEVRMSIDPCGKRYSEDKGLKLYLNVTFTLKVTTIILAVNSFLIRFLFQSEIYEVCASVNIFVEDVVFMNFIHKITSENRMW